MTDELYFENSSNKYYITCTVKSTNNVSLLILNWCSKTERCSEKLDSIGVFLSIRYRHLVHHIQCHTHISQHFCQPLWDPEKQKTSEAIAGSRLCSIPYRSLNENRQKTGGSNRKKNIDNENTRAASVMRKDCGCAQLRQRHENKK